jgi:hypothetical protein
MKSTERELESLTELKHPYIVELLGVAMSADSPCFILECADIDLHSALHR